MQYCAVYRTQKKPGLYLYVAKKDQFDAVPAALMQQIVQPELVMILPLNESTSLASVDKQSLIDELNEKGFYLQMPSQQEDWLGEHRRSLGLSAHVPSRESK